MNARDRFVEEFWRDHEAGRAVSVEEYVGRFPEAGEEVRREYAELMKVVMEDSESTRQMVMGGRLDFRERTQVGKYRIVKVMARSGQADVYLARDEGIPRDVVLKVFEGRNEADAPDIKREVQVTAELAQQVPAEVPEIFEVASADGCVVVAMALVKGRTLAEVLADWKRRSKEGTASKDEIWKEPWLRVMSAIARTLEQAHRKGIIHRDLKPGNLMVRESMKPVVLDFGLALVKNRGEGFERLAGTPHYMSPEQIVGDEVAADARSDVYGLGATLYALATHEVPYAGFRGDRSRLVRAMLLESIPRPRSIRKMIPADFEAIVLRCLAKNPEDRYATMGDLALDLEQLADGRRVSVGKPSFLRVLASGAKRNPLGTASLILLFLGAIGLSVFIGFRTAMSKFDEILVPSLASALPIRMCLGSAQDLLQAVPKVGPEDAPWIGTTFEPWTGERKELEDWISKCQEILESRKVAELVARDLERRAARPRSSADEARDEALRRERYPEIYNTLRVEAASLEELETNYKTSRDAARRREIQEAIDEKRSVVRRLREHPAMTKRLTWRFSSDHEDLLYRDAQALLETLDRLQVTQASVQKVLDATRFARERWRLYSEAEAREGAEAALLPKDLPGFVPLVRDQKSGHWDFWFMPSGPLPDFDDTKTKRECVPSPIHGLVFRRIPTGEFTLGEESTDPSSDTGPVQKVSLETWLIARTLVSKVHEANLRKERLSLQDLPESTAPVRLRWHEAEAWLENFGLYLPTEAQWEAAARLGAARPGDFLRDLYQDTWEWCRDAYGPYRDAEAASPEGFRDHVRASRSAPRVVRGAPNHDEKRTGSATVRGSFGPELLAGIRPVLRVLRAGP